MQAKIYQSGRNGIIAEYDDAETGNRIQRLFFLPRSKSDAYIREVMGSGDYVQVCERLNHRGRTLAACDIEHALDIIRNEYRAMRRREKSQ